MILNVANAFLGQGFYANFNQHLPGAPLSHSMNESITYIAAHPLHSHLELDLHQRTP